MPAADAPIDPLVLRRMRVLGFAAVVLYPAWALLLRFAVPGAELNMGGRLGVAALLAGVIGASYPSAWVRNRIETVALAGALLLIAHNAMHVRDNAHHPACVLGYLLIAFSITYALERLWHMTVFIAVAAALAFGIGSDGQYVTTTFFGFATLLAMPVCLLATRDRVLLLATLKAKNRELEAGRALLAETGALAKTGGWTLAVPTGTMWWSEQTYAIFGLAPGTPVDMARLTGLCTPAAAATLTAALRAATDAGTPFDVELELAAGPGAWLRAIGKAERQDGRTARVGGAFQDITEQKRLREDLIGRESYIRAVIDAIPGFLLWIADDLTYLGVNRMVAETLGLAPEDFIGRPLGFAGDQSSAQMRALAMAAFAASAPLTALETTFVGTDGRRVEVLLTARKYQGGRAMVVFGLDISRQKLFEHELRQQHQLIAQVLDHLPLGVYAKDATADFRVSIWNRRMESILGIPREAAIGRADKELFAAPEAARLTRLDSFVMAGGTLLDVPEETVQGRAGALPAHTVRVPVYTAEGRPLLLLGVVEDIREAKEREALIRSQQAQLLQASKMSTLGEMSGGVAHEINNPLAVILGFAQRLEQLIAAGELAPAELSRCAGRIVAMTDRIARIVRGLRTFAREASADPFEMTALTRVVTETLELCRQRFLHHGVKLEVGQLPETLAFECRAVQISQVLLNLLSNAFDAVRELPEKWVRIDAEDLGDRFRIGVTDSGNGIPADIAAKVLNPFFTTKGVGEGTGLGLSISRGLVETHGGTLRYDPTSPKTRFLVELPKHQQEAKPKAAA